MRTYCIAHGTRISALWWPKWEEIQKRGDICIHMADSLCCTWETDTAVEHNYTPTKKKGRVHIYYGILLSYKKNEIMPFAATWMQLEIIILSEVSQKEKYKYHVIYLHVESKIWHKWTSLRNRSRIKDIENRSVAAKGLGRGGVGG